MTVSNQVLAQTFVIKHTVATNLKQAALVVFGVVYLALFSKIVVPMWPVPITMGTFAVLSLGAAYGPRLGLTTILAYLLVGILGLDVFAGSSADTYGIAYMMGSTGGYLVGYIFAALLMGVLAKKGWDRSPVKMAGAMLLGNAVIYIPGLLWLGIIYGWDQPILAWGLFPFLVGDAAKLVLAAMLLPAAWKIIGKNQT